MADATLRRQVIRLMFGRAIISTILLGSATFMQITAPGSFAVNPFFFMIGLTYALTISYALTLRFVDRHRWLVDLQLGIDAFVVSAFIYFTGGITSYFTSLFVLPVIAASTIQFRRGGLLVATLSTVLYVGLVLAQYLAAEGLRTDPWLISASVTLPPGSVARYTTALNVFGFFAVALLSGSLADSEVGLTVAHRETPGGRAGLLFTFQDVTAIKKLEHDVAIQQRLAAVGEMAAGIAHEIRNPLASMSGSIQILRQELPLSTEQE